MKPNCLFKATKFSTILVPVTAILPLSRAASAKFSLNKADSPLVIDMDLPNLLVCSSAALIPLTSSAINAIGPKDLDKFLPKCPIKSPATANLVLNLPA